MTGLESGCVEDEVTLGGARSTLRLGTAGGGRALDVSGRRFEARGGIGGNAIAAGAAAVDG